MSISNELPPAVRQGTSWKPTILLGFVTCALTILVVQLCGQIRAQIHEAKIEPATAIVGQCPAVCNEGACARCVRQPAGQTAVCAKAVQAIKDQVTSPDLVRQVWQDLGLADAASHTEQLRRALKVEVADSPMGGKCLRLTLAWPNPQDAARILKVLGNRYAEKYQKASAGAQEREFSEAKRASEQAGQAFDEALADLDFFENWLAWQSAATAAEVPKPSRNEFSSLSPLPSPVENTTGPLRDISDTENPEWVNLQKELVGLQEKEARLLETRTSMHPDVKSLQDEIREGEAKLATLPRWIHNDRSALSLRDELGTQAEVPTASGNIGKENTVAEKTSAVQKSLIEAKDAELLVELEDEVQSAAQAYSEAMTHERAVSGPRGIGSEIAVRVFIPKRIAAEKPLQPPFAWLMGMVMAVGACLVGGGTTVEPPIASVKELRRIASAPIIGVVPSYNPAVDSRAIKRRKLFLRSGLFLTGMVLMGLCVWAIVRIV